MEKLLTAFSLHRGRPDGLQPFCKPCDNGRTRTHRWKTIGGVRSNLVVKHGLSPRTADIIAARLFNPYERCAICGIPNRILALHSRRGYPFIWGDERRNRRLTVDHIVPGGPSVLGNLRLLCYACNSHRGAAERTDKMVLRWIRKKYLAALSRAECWWLRESLDDNAIEYRGKKHGDLVNAQS